MKFGVEEKLLWPAFLIGVLALFFDRTYCAGARHKKFAATTAALETEANTYAKA